MKGKLLTFLCLHATFWHAEEQSASFEGLRYKQRFSLVKLNTDRTFSSVRHTSRCTVSFNLGGIFIFFIVIRCCTICVVKQVNKQLSCEADSIWASQWSRISWYEDERTFLDGFKTAINFSFCCFFGQAHINICAALKKKCLETARRQGRGRQRSEQRGEGATRPSSFI